MVILPYQLPILDNSRFNISLCFRSSDNDSNCTRSQFLQHHSKKNAITLGKKPPIKFQTLEYWPLANAKCRDVLFVLSSGLVPDGFAVDCNHKEYIPCFTPLTVKKVQQSWIDKHLPPVRLNIPWYRRKKELDIDIVIGEEDQSCDQVCGKLGAYCEKSFFNYLNNMNVLKNYCEKFATLPPNEENSRNVEIKDDTCYFSGIKNSMTCNEKRLGFKRMCPCVHYT